MKDFLEYLIKQLIDHPDELVVEEESKDTETVFSLNLNKEDIGKVIGRDGKIIHAIRNLVKVLAIKEGKLVRVEIKESA